MSIKKLILIGALCSFFAGCTTGGNMQVNDVPNTTAGMGERYLLGHGVPQSNTKAFAYFTKAANEGDVFAQNELAYMYAAGKGTPKDSTKAFEWYKRAANSDLASAQYNVGLMYQHGMGTTVDKEAAIKWYKKSAAHHFEPAMVALEQAQV